MVFAKKNGFEFFWSFFQGGGIPAYTTNLKRDHLQDDIIPFKDILILSFMIKISLQLARGLYFLFPLAFAGYSEGFSEQPSLNWFVVLKWNTWLNYKTYF